MSTGAKSVLKAGQLRELAELSSEGKRAWAVEETGLQYEDFIRLEAERTKPFWLRQLRIEDLLSDCFPSGNLWCGKGSLPKHFVNMLNVFAEAVGQPRLQYQDEEIDADMKKLLISVKDTKRAKLEKEIRESSVVKFEEGVDLPSGFVRPESRHHQAMQRQGRGTQ